MSRDLKVKGFLSLIFACLLILVYVWLRFDWDFAPGAVIALAHDAIVTAGLFSILGKTFDLSIVAAILALIGYSVNDTVVIYDRIRENIEKLPGKNFPDIINISVNETLSRSVITSGATLITTVFIWLMGGPTLEGFGFALTVGIIAGSYSTIFVASPLIIVLRNLQGRRRGTAGKQPTPAAYRSAS